MGQKKNVARDKFVEYENGYKVQLTANELFSNQVNKIFDNNKELINKKFARITHVLGRNLNLAFEQLNRDIQGDIVLLSKIKPELDVLEFYFELQCVLRNLPFQKDLQPKFTFIDLFAGIGGFRLALQSLGGDCVYSSEWDTEAQKTYFNNFGEIPFGDITDEANKSEIPDDFDILCAGFPCQAFSIAGRRGGFEDTRGTLFFDVAEIIKRKRPKAVFLENVKGLRNHDKGKTLATILNVLRDDLNYYVPEPKIINARDYGVPQNRERIYIVAFNKDYIEDENFRYPEPVSYKLSFIDIRESKPVDTRYYLSTQYLWTLENHKKRHEEKGNGFGYQIIGDQEVANAVVCGGMGRERNLVVDDRITDFTPTTKIKGEVNKLGIRKMTPREWARLQGFPDNFIIPVSDASAYKQFGNSVAVPAIRATAFEILKKLNLC
jgi:DNA (cytosine-5)-methyltransferase 1